jgi:hypothetical protein
MYKSIEKIENSVRSIELNPAVRGDTALNILWVILSAVDKCAKAPFHSNNPMQILPNTSGANIAADIVRNAKLESFIFSPYVD